MIKTVCVLAWIGAVLAGRPENVDTNTRIIGGNPAIPGFNPWQVSLQVPYNDGYWHFCGGSIISKNFVLTAAHCNIYDPAIVTVYAGSVDKFTGGVRLTISSFLSHPEYNAAEISMDFAIIELSTTLMFSKNINSIRIPGPQYNADSEFPGFTLTSGWGYDVYDPQNSTNNSIPDHLQTAILLAYYDDSCSCLYGSFYQPSNMICAGRSAEEETTCQGDSGGPLVTFLPHQGLTLIGVTSWGPTSCTTMFASGFAKVSTVRQWIIDNTDLMH